MLVKDAMTKPAITVVSGAPLSDAISLLVGYKLSGLPVVDEQGKICGILSEGDLLRRIETGTTERAKHWWSRVFSRHSGAEAYRMTEGRRVSDVMSEPAVTIEETATLSIAASLMEKSGIKRIPVMRNGALVGMLTRADFVKILRSFIAPAYEEPAVSDAEIKDRFHTELRHQRWAINCGGSDGSPRRACEIDRIGSKRITARGDPCRGRKHCRGPERRQQRRSFLSRGRSWILITLHLVL